MTLVRRTSRRTCNFFTFAELSTGSREEMCFISGGRPGSTNSFASQKCTKTTSWYYLHKETTFFLRSTLFDEFLNFNLDFCTRRNKNYCWRNGRFCKEEKLPRQKREGRCWELDVIVRVLKKSTVPILMRKYL